METDTQMGRETDRQSDGQNRERIERIKSYVAENSRVEKMLYFFLFKTFMILHISVLKFTPILVHLSISTLNFPPLPTAISFSHPFSLSLFLSSSLSLTPSLFLSPPLSFSHQPLSFSHPPLSLIAFIQLVSSLICLVFTHLSSKFHLCQGLHLIYI